MSQRTVKEEEIVGGSLKTARGIVTVTPDVHVRGPVLDHHLGATTVLVTVQNKIDTIRGIARSKNGETRRDEERSVYGQAD